MNVWVGLESVQELLQDLILSLLACLDIRVESGAVESLQIIDGDATRPVSVELVEGLFNKLLPVVVDGSSDSQKELVIIQAAILVLVEEVEDLLDVTVSNVDLEVADRLPELTDIERSGVVVIEDLFEKK